MRKIHAVNVKASILLLVNHLGIVNHNSVYFPCAIKYSICIAGVLKEMTTNKTILWNWFQFNHHICLFWCILSVWWTICKSLDKKRQKTDNICFSTGSRKIIRWWEPLARPRAWPCIVLRLSNSSPCLCIFLYLSLSLSLSLKNYGQTISSNLYFISPWWR